MSQRTDVTFLLIFLSHRRKKGPVALANSLRWLQLYVVGFVELILGLAALANPATSGVEEQLVLVMYSPVN